MKNDNYNYDVDDEKERKSERERKTEKNICDLSDGDDDVKRSYFALVKDEQQLARNINVYKERESYKRVHKLNEHSWHWLQNGRKCEKMPKQTYIYTLTHR